MLLTWRAMRLGKLLPFAVIVALTVGAAANAATPALRIDMPYAMVLRVLDEPGGKYQVEIENGNPTRFVSSFNWTPPSGLNVTAVTASIGGICRLTGDGIIVCKGLAPPPNSMTSVGGSIIVNFTATGRQPTWTGSYWIHYGVLGSVQVQMTRFNDLPLCPKGHKHGRAPLRQGLRKPVRRRGLVGRPSTSLWRV